MRKNYDTKQKSSNFLPETVKVVSSLNITGSGRIIHPVGRSFM